MSRESVDLTIENAGVGVGRLLVRQNFIVRELLSHKIGLAAFNADAELAKLKADPEAFAAACRQAVEQACVSADFEPPLPTQ